MFGIKQVRALFAALIFAAAGVSSHAGELLLMTEDYPPENYVVKDGAKESVTGICVDMVREIQRRVNNNSPIKVVIWQDGYAQLLKTPNSAIFAIGKNPIREKEMKLVGPVGETDFCFFALAEKKIALKTLEDAQQHRVGVYQADAAEQFLRAQGFNNLLVADTDRYNLDRLLNGEIALWLTGQAKARMLMGQKKVPADKVLGLYVAFVTPLYIGFNKDSDPKIVEAWQAALDKMKSDGTYDKIRTDWLRKLSDGQATLK